MIKLHSTFLTISFTSFFVLLGNSRGGAYGFNTGRLGGPGYPYTAANVLSAQDPYFGLGGPMGGLTGLSAAAGRNPMDVIQKCKLEENGKVDLCLLKLLFPFFLVLLLC